MASAKSKTATASQLGEVNANVAGLGFEVIGSSPVTVTVEGSSALFKKVFGAGVKGRRVTPSRDSLEHSTPGIVWKFESPPVIPEQLRDYVNDVAFPSFSSAH
ncbi:hypothetical protein [Luteolibacter sp. Populi]|uniref:hypothetical protein n=1 Tax=Luteolibacter sp. Populi TaxID=3230487 RepID=UPI003466BFBF